MGHTPAFPEAIAAPNEDRRGFLRRLGLGAAAVAGATVAASKPANAASGQPVVQGVMNDAGSATTILKSTGKALVVQGTGNDAIEAITNAAGRSGVFAHNDATRQVGKTNYGVFGGASDGVGVFGLGGVGVWGESANGYGVQGMAKSWNSIGVRASADGSALALSVDGRARINPSGIASVVGTARTPRDSVTLPIGLFPGRLDDGTMVFATLQGPPVASLFVRTVHVDTANQAVTIYLSEKVVRTVKVAWVALYMRAAPPT